MLRHLIAAALALSTPLAAQPAPTTEIENPEAAALASAFNFAFPLYTMARTRSLMPSINTLTYRTKLADEKSRDVTTPNNDTLYASAFLDLAAGPVILSMPEIAGRYHSVAIMNMATDNLAILGTRTGSAGAKYALIAADYTGPTPEGTLPLRLDCRDCWLLARVIVNGPDDVEAAAEALQGITLEAPEAELAAFEAATPALPNAEIFLAAVNEVIARAGPASKLAERAKSFPALADPALWTGAMLPLATELRQSLATAGTLVGGWSYPDATIGNPGDNDLLRAQIALGGLGALPRVEAMYLSARTDGEGQPLDGKNAYSLRIPYNMPIGGFWSLSMYEQASDGRLFYVGNPLSRFAVGDRSQHLRADRDGSTEIFIQSTRPEGERVVNWLPSPEGRFVLIFRAYLPKSEMLDGSFRLPPVVTSERIP
jgi:hypothetical protein